MFIFFCETSTFIACSHSYMKGNDLVTAGRAFARPHGRFHVSSIFHQITIRPQYYMSLLQPVTTVDSFRLPLSL